MLDLHLGDLSFVAQDMLIALDGGAHRAWLQPLHSFARLTHLISMAVFFGGILLLDLRLVGLRSRTNVKVISSYILPYVIVALALTLTSGVILFLIDPLTVYSRPYFIPKMLLIGFGVANALVFQFAGHLKSMSLIRTIPRAARATGVLSIALWFGVVACANFNKAGPEKAPVMAMQKNLAVTVRTKGDFR